MTADLIASMIIITATVFLLAGIGLGCWIGEVRHRNLLRRFRGFGSGK